MPPRLRIAIPAIVTAALVVGAVVMSGGSGRPAPTGAANASAPPAGGLAPSPSPTPRPEIGGRELYGYVPYWRMNASTATYLRDVPLSTVALFSIGALGDGSLNTSRVGYQRIVGPIGRQIIAEAHSRQVRVELVFSSFGERRNSRFFATSDVNSLPTAAPGSSVAAEAPQSGASGLSGEPGLSGDPGAGDPARNWRFTVAALVELAVDLDVDGINVDVERLPEANREGYRLFLQTLRERLLEAKPKARVTVATEAGERGVGNAATAAAAGVDRVFLMGYDYHWSGSQPGASSPIDRVDGIYDLRWSIDRYVEAGVPRNRILLGLPLYGMTWRTTGPERFSSVVGSGKSWILDGNLDVLLDPEFEPQHDPIEHAEFFVEQDGDTWLQTYYDSPATLRLKLALARDQGLAGGGFWAIGYEQGLPGYLELMGDFRDGKVDRSEAPPPSSLSRITGP